MQLIIHIFIYHIYITYISYMFGKDATELKKINVYHVDNEYVIH